MNNFIIDYKKPECNVEVLAQYGEIIYKSKYMTIAVLKSDCSIEEIQAIKGVKSVYIEERNVMEA